MGIIWEQEEREIEMSKQKACEQSWWRIPIDSLNNNLILVKVGNNDRPAAIEDINDAVKQWKEVEKTLKEHNVNCTILVMHHAMDIEVVDGCDFVKIAGKPGRKSNKK